MSRRAALLLAGFVTAFAAFTSWVGAESGAPPEFLVADAVTGLSFVLAGVAAAWLRPGSPAGPLLLVGGGFWFAGSYAPTGRDVLTHLGFAFERYYDLALAFLLLRLTAADQSLRPRLLAGALAATMVARSVVRLLLQDPVQDIPDCGDCPANPFAIWHDPSRFQAGEVATNAILAILFAAVGLLALARLVSAGSLARRARWPVVVAGVVAMAAATVDVAEYSYSTATGRFLIEVDDSVSGLLDWALFGMRVLVPVGFLAGTLRLRSAAGPLAPLAAQLGRDPDGQERSIADVLRTSLGDASLRLLRPAPDGRTWLDEDGSAATAAAPAGRARTLVGPPESPTAALDHDAALLDHRELLEAVVAMLRLNLDNARLGAELRTQLRAVTDSRARIVTATEEERRRLERDLHDGAQQRLVGVTPALQEARAAADATTAPAALRQQLAATAEELGQAIQELRELARGIHPAILETEGLGPAVTGLARRATIPVAVELELDGRVPPVVESTAYFTIAEALTNAQRSAEASRATVRIRTSQDGLRVEVDDDGRGGADPSKGSGLRGLADRVGALGGRLEVDSPLGTGTTVRAWIPIPMAAE